MEEEFWTNIKGYRDYAISTYGNVENMMSCKILKPVSDKDGYCCVNLCKNSKRKMYKIHRLVALNFIANPENKPLVDHRDGNKQNNNINNLRWATNQENQRNAKLSIGNTSGIKGVCWHKRPKKWCASIKVNGRTMSLGFFDNIEEAKQVRQNKVYEIYGEFVNDCEKIK